MISVMDGDIDGYTKHSWWWWKNIYIYIYPNVNTANIDDVIQSVSGHGHILYYNNKYFDMCEIESYAYHTTIDFQSLSGIYW